MQTISVGTTQNVSIEHPVASVGDRILAYLIDVVVIIAYYILMALWVNLAIQSDGFLWAWIVITVFPVMFYSLGCEIFMNGQSLGKKAMNIQVVRVDGTEPSVGNYIVRWLFRIIDIQLLSGAIAVLTIIINGRGQRLGDIAAGTTVIKLVPSRRVDASSLFVTTADSYSPVFPQAQQLRSQDIEIIQRALSAEIQHGNERPVMAIAQKIKEVLNVETDMADAEFLHTVVRDYNHLNAL